VYQFIETHRQEFGVKRMCQVLAVSSSGYYAWRARPPSQRAHANRCLLEPIRAIHQASRQTYGARRVHAALRAQGIHCNHKRVERLMRAAGLRVTLRRRHKTTTRAARNGLVVPNRLNRDFSAPAPNRVWLADITYIHTQQGWLYLAVILGMFSRKIVGWQMSDHIDERLTQDALLMALHQRQPLPGHLLHHSDRGAQYTSRHYLHPLLALQATLSMSRTGNCYDNAPMESFFATLKTELIHRTVFLTRHQARAAIFAYIEIFYNRVRRHSSLHYLSPDEFERAFAD
jgi:putative transposase